MNLFIGNLPSQATEQGLSSLLRMSPREAQGRLRIFKKADRTGRTLRFGIVHVASDSELRKLLNRNRSAQMLGQSLDVREFLPRAVSNERRSVDWRSRLWTQPERRVSERRASV